MCVCVYLDSMIFSAPASGAQAIAQFAKELLDPGSPQVM